MPDVKRCSTIRSNQIPANLYRQFLSSAGWAEPFVLDVGYRLGRAKGSYVDEVTLKSGSIDKLAHSIGANAGLFVTRLGPLTAGLISAGYSYAVDYTKSSSTQICTPFGTAGALRCRSAVIGRPRRKETGLIEGEIRAFITPRWGIDPHYVWSIEEKAWSLETPVYFIPDGKGTLIGGIAPRYWSESKDWELRVFLGKAFGM